MKRIGLLAVFVVLLIFSAACDKITDAPDYVYETKEFYAEASDGAWEDECHAYFVNKTTDECKEIFCEQKISDEEATFITPNVSDMPGWSTDHNFYLAMSCDPKDDEPLVEVRAAPAMSPTKPTLFDAGWSNDNTYLGWFVNINWSEDCDFEATGNFCIGIELTYCDEDDDLYIPGWGGGEVRVFHDNQSLPYDGLQAYTLFSSTHPISFPINMADVGAPSNDCVTLPEQAHLWLPVSIPESEVPYPGSWVFTMGAQITDATGYISNRYDHLTLVVHRDDYGGGSMPECDPDQCPLPGYGCVDMHEEYPINPCVVCCPIWEECLMYGHVAFTPYGSGWRAKYGEPDSCDDGLSCTTGDFCSEGYCFGTWRDDPNNGQPGCEQCIEDPTRPSGYYCWP